MSRPARKLSIDHLTKTAPEGEEAIFVEGAIANQIPADTRLTFVYLHDSGYETVADVRFVVSPDGSSVYVDADVRGSNNSWATSVSGHIDAIQLMREAKIVALKAIAT